ncbi:hypothetical protein [Lentzea terrae]|uniref:hypothetical protein n=1 Tax=Lentzea terrae TaxID=2200761 RepID=UPI0013009250|nr:hypothetical protein [Lentzea terrae]
MTMCEVNECRNEATHTVRIAPTGYSEEMWEVCRADDRALKRTFTQGVTQWVPPPDMAPIVRCGECGQALTDASPPCPVCGSLDKSIADGDTVTAHERVCVRSKYPGKGGWIIEVKAGDEFTRDLNAWSRRELTIDRAQDRYREVVELYDGSRLESTAKLRDHRG